MKPTVSSPKMTRKKLDRLIALVDYVEDKVTDDAFDMDNVLYKTSCGTVGCMLGYAPFVPKLKRIGLKVKWSSPNYSDGHQEGVLMFEGEVLSFYALAAKLFGMTAHETEDMFVARQGHIARKTVIRNFRTFIKEKSKELGE